MASRKLGIAKKLKRQRKLRRKQADRPSAGCPIHSSRVLAEPSGLEKMSEVLDRFVEPYMKLATTEAGVRNVYSYGMAAWNASFSPVDKQKEKIDRILREAQVADEVQIVVRSLLSRT